jgi:hypothetical protein
MGTTSGGSSGNNSGRGGGGGRRSGIQGGGNGDYGIPSFFSNQGEMIPISYDEEKIQNIVRNNFKGLFSHSLDYTKTCFTNEFLQKVYDELFKLSELIADEKKTDDIAKRYDIDLMNSGFYFQLVDKFMELQNSMEIDYRCIDTIQFLLDQLLQKSLGKKLELIAKGNGYEVIDAMRENKEFWQTLSGQFLFELASIIILKEIEEPNNIFLYKKVIEALTNNVITDYEEKTKNDNGIIDYTGLINYISNNFDWFKGEITK